MDSIRSRALESSRAYYSPFMAIGGVVAGISRQKQDFSRSPYSPLMTIVHGVFEMECSQNAI